MPLGSIEYACPHIRPAESRRRLIDRPVAGTAHVLLAPAARAIELVGTDAHVAGLIGATSWALFSWALTSSS